MSDTPSDPGMPPPGGDPWAAPAPPPPPPGGGDAWAAPPPPPAQDWGAQPGYTDPAYAAGGVPQAYGVVPPGYEQKQKIVAGILGILLGYLGVHSFYLGNTKKGIIQIIVSVVTCGIGGLWGFIEGIMILTGSINVDANGVPLKD